MTAVLFPISCCCFLHRVQLKQKQTDIKNNPLPIGKNNKKTSFNRRKMLQWWIWSEAMYPRVPSEAKLSPYLGVSGLVAELLFSYVLVKEWNYHFAVLQYMKSIRKSFAGNYTNFFPLHLGKQKTRIHLMLMSLRLWTPTLWNCIWSPKVFQFKC